MSRITRLAVLAMSLFGVLSSSAGAATWTNTGQTSFTATAGLSQVLASGMILACASASATGTAPASSAGPAIAIGTATITGCRLAGVAAHVHCSFTFTASSISGGVTSGTVDRTCDVTQSSGTTCHISSPTSATYTNPGAAGVLALATSTRVTVTGATCRLGNGVTGHTDPLTFTVTSGTGPVFAMD